MSNIKIDELNELEIPKYGPVFFCVYDLFGDYSGVFFKIIIDGVVKILQRRDDLFVIYELGENNSISYEMFSVDEDYKVSSAGFDDFEMHTISGDRVIQYRESNNIENLIFLKRRDGGDVDGFDGSVAYVQYNQEQDVRMMLIFQQMYNSSGKIYSWHVNKEPFQILIERGVALKQNGRKIVPRDERYIRVNFDVRDEPGKYDICVIKDYGLKEFMDKGAFSLHKQNEIIRYYKMIAKTGDGYAITTFPFGRQYKFTDFYELFSKYGFKIRIPEQLIAIHNDEDVTLNNYQAIANFMKEIEMTPPDDVITLNLKFKEEE